MTAPTLVDYLNAKQLLDAGDFTQDGLPKMKALNKVLKANGLGAMTGAKRDAFEATGAETEAEAETVSCRITGAPADPVHVRQDGKLLGAFRVGEPFEATADVLEILTNSNIEFEKI